MDSLNTGGMVGKIGGPGTIVEIEIEVRGARDYYLYGSVEGLQRTV